MTQSYATIDSSRWRQRIATLTISPGEDIGLNYIECPPAAKQKGVILLIHGFPQTSYQFRHIINPLAHAGYHVVAPDYRGVGHSSKPNRGYEKT